MAPLAAAKHKRQRDMMNHPQRNCSVCVVSHFAFGEMAGGRSGHIGGVEWQTSLTAKWLAKRGHEVTIVTWDEGQAHDTVIDGVRVIGVCREDAGWPGLRFFWPRWTGLNRAMRLANADVYYHNCGEYVTGQVALWCRRHGRGFVYSVANDPDCDVSLPEMPEWRVRLFYRYGLQHADRVIVQTAKQQRMLRDGFGVASVIIPMPCLGPTVYEYSTHRLQDQTRPHVAWVGRIAEQKRPHYLTELAPMLPNVCFDVVGSSNTQSQYAETVLESLRGLPNVVVHGYVPRDHMPEIYRKSSVLCSTSAYEGFPNTFLEAWSCGVPVVSTFDPDGVIAKCNLGAVATDVPSLAAEIKRLLQQPEAWQLASTKCRRYYLENHSLEVVMPRFEQLFLKAAVNRQR